MKVVIIGSGNVATVMGGRATGAGHRIVQVVARREEAAARLAAEWNCAYTTQWGKTDAEADIYIVSVSDRALEGLELRLPGRLVVHTAGAVAGSVLRSVTERWGVLYPLQSLRSEIRPYPEFPLLITAGRGEDLSIIGDFARTISPRVQEADDATRLKLHVAATSVNNFTNWLYTQAELFCNKEQLDFSLLYPLIAETSQRLLRYSPGDVQTGPAIRGDQGTIRRHLEILNNYKDLSELYRLFSIQIERFYRGRKKAAALEAVLKNYYFYDMSVLEKFKSIRTFVFDVDGVMTDGDVILYETGEQVRRMNTRDGYSLQLAVKKGYRVVVISGGSSEGVRQRLLYLGIRDIYLQVHDKVKVLEEYAKEHALDERDMLYMGDDIPDLLAMRHVGLACAPADAAPEIRHIAAYISSFNGGQGCVRDVIEKVLKLNGHWDFDSSVASK